MAFFKRVDPAEFSNLPPHLGGRRDVLAHGTGDDVTLIVTREVLALRTGSEWTSWRWEEIASGSWKSESQTFRWRTMSGEKHETVLSEVHDLPAVFRERVQASTVVQTVVHPARGEVQIIGRRGLGADTTMRWYAVPSGGADLADPATRVLVVEETDRLKSDYF